MQDYLFVSWNLHDKGGVKAAQAILQRCDLRHVAHQELDVPMDDPDTDEPWSTGSHGWLRLTKDDPRLPRLFDEFRALGERPFVRLCRVYSRAEREAAPWLVVTGSSTMVEVSAQVEQSWDFTGACPACGAGARPVPPLKLHLSRMPKSGWIFTSPNGFVIVSKALAKVLQTEKLTGFDLATVRSPSRPAPDDRFCWLRATSHWPPPVRTPTCRVSNPCQACGRPILGGGAPFEIHYDTVPENPCDFNMWQGSLESDRLNGRVNRPTGGTTQLFLSQRAYAVLKRAGVRSLRVEPVYFAR